MLHDIDAVPCRAGWVTGQLPTSFEIELARCVGSSKVRGLGDIPILGQLFRSRSTNKSNDELLVVITPHFVRPLAPNDNAKLPDMLEPWLPTLAEQQAAKDKKNNSKQPEFVGPRGHQEPKPPQ